jgi:hypothetical protein
LRSQEIDDRQFHSRQSEDGELFSLGVARFVGERTSLDFTAVLVRFILFFQAFACIVVGNLAVDRVTSVCVFNL